MIRRKLGTREDLCLGLSFRDRGLWPFPNDMRRLLPLAPAQLHIIFAVQIHQLSGASRKDICACLDDQNLGGGTAAADPSSCSASASGDAGVAAVASRGNFQHP